MRRLGVRGPQAKSICQGKPGVQARRQWVRYAVRDNSGKMEEEKGNSAELLDWARRGGISLRGGMRHKYAAPLSPEGGKTSGKETRKSAPKNLANQPKQTKREHTPNSTRRERGAVPLTV